MRREYRADADPPTGARPPRDTDVPVSRRPAVSETQTCLAVVDQLQHELETARAARREVQAAFEESDAENCRLADALAVAERERDEARELAYDLAGRVSLEMLRWFFRAHPWAKEIADRREREWEARDAAEREPENEQL